MPTKSKIQDQTFLFTGTLTEFTRDEAEALVEANGGKVISGVTAKLNYLVVGEDAGSKLDKAKKLGTVKILTEKEFLKMVPKGKEYSDKKTSLAAKNKSASKGKNVTKLKSDNSSKENLRSKSKGGSVLQEVVFACNSSTNLCECHGMEIAIGELTNDNLAEIADFVEEGMYSESDYFTSWYQFGSIFHENGVFLDGCDIEDLEDKNGLSTSNWKMGNVAIGDVILKKKGAYLCTFRNETIYMVAKSTAEGKGIKKIDCEISKFSFLEELADVSVSILTSAYIAGELMERDSANEEDSGEIYDTHQFLVKDGKIVFYLTNGNGQYPFYLDDSIIELTRDMDKKSLKKILTFFKTIGK
jgi:hypothetical protein